LSNQSYSGEIDPEVAELMGIDDESDTGDTPEFSDLFGDKTGSKRDSSAGNLDLSRKTFAPVTTFFESKVNQIFSSTDFYKQALSGEGEAAKRVHSLLAKFLNVEDPKERSLYRSKLIAAYWNMATLIAVKIHTRLPDAKRFMLRFGYLLPTVLSKAQRDLLGRVIDRNDSGEPIHYVDEWLRKVAHGEVGQSAQDEVRASQKNHGERLMVQIDKARGSRDVQIGLIKSKMNELETAEHVLKEKSNILASHDILEDYYHLKAPYTPDQRSALSEINTILRQILSTDKEMTSLFRHLEEADQLVEKLEHKVSDLGEDIQVDIKSIEQEFNAVRQMTKMCVGRQGNHVPFLMQQYFRPLEKDLGTRENVIRELSFIENIDPGAFTRTYKQQVNRIIPYVLLLPCYGDRGICWEPFEKFNRATSRGRIAIPMYAKDLRTAVISAIADLRWQIAKEKAQHYWMEEGLTGYYYMYAEGQKMKGDIKEYFIQDYLLWITKESEGTQKLNREVRGIFWRNIPFPQTLKDSLRKRGFVYDDLYKKDKNRAMSDGY